MYFTKFIFAVFLCLNFSYLTAQISLERPKLMVGIVVDQMRYDYLLRYYDKYGTGGFKRLMNQGFVCRNAHYNYVPTETAPGHASVYTGTTPSNHGIVGNDWYEKGRKRYCVEDSTVNPVGSQTPNGARSPRNLFVPTIADQIKLATNSRSRTFSVSLKDRGAILPGGHTANGAFWYDGLSGKFITSTYYMPNLPTWLQNFNNQKHTDKILQGKWEPLLGLSAYTESQADANNYEQTLPGKEKPVFPYDLKDMSQKIGKAQIKMSPYELIPLTPFGNSLVKDLAKEIILQEKLGQQGGVDVLTISFSSPDIIGHAFGPQSIEVEDTYLRLDKDIEELLNLLDKEIGEGNYVLFLTADHAGAFTPRYLTDMKIPSGYFPTKEYHKNLKAYLNQLYGEGEWIEYGGDKEVYLNRKLIAEKEKDVEDVQEEVAKWMRTQSGIFDAYTASQLEEENYTNGIRLLVQNGYYHQRSPDVTIVHRSGWLDEGWGKGGTSHGTPFNYDTQVPVLFYGWKIPKGKSTVRKVFITDIVPTLSILLSIQMPDATSGEPIKEIFGE